MTTLRTDPVYAAIAYRRAVIRHIANFLRNRFTSVTGQPPVEVLVCGEVFQEDSEVPQDVIFDVLDELALEESDLEVELGKFRFQRIDEPAPKSKLLRKTRKALKS